MRMAAGARSDSFGRFAVVLGRTQESYEIRAVRAGYASAALYESDIPYARLSLEERREIVRNAQDREMSIAALTDIGEPSVRRDVFLAPNR